MLQVCVAAGTHQALVASLATALLLLLATAAWAGVVYRKTRALDLKNRSVSSSYLKIHRVGELYSKCHCNSPQPNLCMDTGEFSLNI